MNQNNCGQGLERKGLGSKMGVDDVKFFFHLTVWASI